MIASSRQSAPLIDSLSWGNVDVRGHGSFKDVKVWPGGAREWDWTETGTSHTPGVQMTDIEELLEHGIEAVVLSTGQQNVLGVPQEVREQLQQHGITVYVEGTPTAVSRYNELAEQGKAVGALIHSTC